MPKIVNDFTQSAIEPNNYTVSNIRHYKIMSSLRQSKNLTNDFAPRNIQIRPIWHIIIKYLTTIKYIILQCDEKYDITSDYHTF